MGGNMRFGGRPTTADVHELWEKFGVPSGPITYDEVAAVIHVAHRTHRFNTVCHAWRAMLFRDHNVVLRAREGKFTPMNGSERIEHGGGKMKSGLRAIRRADVVVGTTDRAELSEQDRTKADHLQLVSAALIHAAHSESKRAKFRIPEGVKTK